MWPKENLIPVEIVLPGFNNGKSMPINWYADAYSELDIKITQKMFEQMETLTEEPKTEFIENLFVVSPVAFRENNKGYFVPAGFHAPVKLFVAEEQALSWIADNTIACLKSSPYDLSYYYDSEELPDQISYFVGYHTDEVMNTTFNKLKSDVREELANIMTELGVYYTITQLKIED